MEPIFPNMIPAWLISVLSFVAAFSMWKVRPMPRLIRISIIVPLIYFGGLYILIGYEVTSEPVKMFLVRLGLIVLLAPIISNSVLIYWAKRRRGRL